MPLWKQRLLARYQEKAGDDGAASGSGAEGGEGGEGGEGEGGEGEGSEGAEGEGEGGEGGEGKPPAKKPASKVSDAEAALLKENMKRKADLKKATEELTAAKSRLAEFDGLDAKELKELLASKKTAEENQLAAKGEWEKLKARMASEHTAVVTAKDTELASVKEANAKLAAQIDELTIGAAFSGSKFITDETVLTPSKARKVYGEHFDLVEGAVVGFDKPRGASGRTQLVDQLGNPVAFEVAMQKLIEADTDKDHILKSKVKPGAGSASAQRPAAKREEAPTTGLGLISAGLGSLLAGTAPK